MNHAVAGFLLRRERLTRNWSQEGLCHGICAVSYLSKIEQGKVEPGSDILALLFQRLSLPWHDAPEALAPWRQLTDACFDAILSRNHKVCRRLRPALEAALPDLSYSPLAPEAALLNGLLLSPFTPIEEALEPFLDTRQLALQRMMQGRDEEALRLFPCAYLCLMAGIRAYEQGNPAEPQLQRAYDLAAAEGYVYLMIDAQLFLGNVYSNRLDLAGMNRHYDVAERLAEAVDDKDSLRDLRYNRAATALQVGRYAEGYQYFSTLDTPGKMDLHKLAICCEKLGRREEALEALHRADALDVDSPQRDLAEAMCGLVRFRLCHGDYLRQPSYGRELLATFERLRAELPIGYAAFHLPWVLEWYTASRLYRAAYELVRDFPMRISLSPAQNFPAIYD